MESSPAIRSPAQTSSIHIQLPDLQQAWLEQIGSLIVALKANPDHEDSSLFLSGVSHNLNMMRAKVNPGNEQIFETVAQLLQEALRSEGATKPGNNTGAWGNYSSPRAVSIKATARPPLD